jgi:hypothetical protein
MSWLPDSGWLRALDLRTSIFAAVAFGCWAVLGLAELGLLYLDALPTWLRAAFVIVAVVASLLWLGRLWDVGFARFMGGDRDAQSWRSSTTSARPKPPGCAASERRTSRPSA